MNDEKLFSFFHINFIIIKILCYHHLKWWFDLCAIPCFCIWRIIQNWSILQWENSENGPSQIMFEIQVSFHKSSSSNTWHVWLFCLFVCLFVGLQINVLYNHETHTHDIRSYLLVVVVVVVWIKRSRKKTHQCFMNEKKWEREDNQPAEKTPINQPQAQHSVTGTKSDKFTNESCFLFLFCWLVSMVTILKPNLKKNEIEHDDVDEWEIVPRPNSDKNQQTWKLDFYDANMCVCVWGIFRSNLISDRLLLILKVQLHWFIIPLW